jgi:hypothetical protein
MVVAEPGSRSSVAVSKSVVVCAVAIRARPVTESEPLPVAVVVAPQVARMAVAAWLFGDWLWLCCLVVVVVWLVVVWLLFGCCLVVVLVVVVLSVKKPIYK